MFGLSPQLGMCGLRDVLGVFRDFGASVLGLGRSLRAGICDLRDVSEVFSRSRCVGTFPTRDNVSFARRFGGVRSSRCENVVFARRFGGVRRILAKVRMCRLRDVSEVFL